MKAAFLDFATLGPGVDTAALDALLEVSYHARCTPDEIRERLGGKQVALLNKATLDRDLIAGSRELKLIVLAATGTDNVDLAAAEARGVAVSNIRDYCTAAVVEHVMALVLGLTRRLGGCPTPRSGTAWQASETRVLFEYPLRELAGKTLGVVGYGTLGRGLAQAARCFGMDVLVAERPAATPGGVRAGRTPWRELLRRADVVSLHCPLTDENRHMIGAAELRLMKREALLINTARGALIDSAALVEALEAGVIGGAGIDVLESEPPPDDEPLLRPDIPNLILTPHIAWTARESRQRAVDQMAENVADFLDGGRLRRVV